jgi:hypothetical protein
MHSLGIQHAANRSANRPFRRNELCHCPLLLITNSQSRVSPTPARVSERDSGDRISSALCRDSCETTPLQSWKLISANNAPNRALQTGHLPPGGSRQSLQLPQYSHCSIAGRTSTASSARWWRPLPTARRSAGSSRLTKCDN